MTTNTRIDLQVPYSEKDQAKVHGAQWDTANRTWYAPAGTDLQKLKRWLPKDFFLAETPAPATTPPSTKVAEKGVSLSELLGQVKGSPSPSGFVPRFLNYVARTATSISP
jgi:exodeoxyribonuclease VII large subunit